MQIIQGSDTIVKIVFNDTDNGNKIDEANVTVVFKNWNGSDKIINTDSSEMFSGGGNYIIALPTGPNNLGKHNVEVYASKNYYDDAENLAMFVITVLEDTSLSYLEVPVIPLVTNTSIVINALNSTGPLRYIDNVTANYPVISYNTDDVAGVYTITLETDHLNVGTYPISISINKTNHVNRTITIPLTVRSITSDFTYIPPGQIHWSDTKNATITLYYMDLDHGTGIDDAFINLTGWYDSGGVGYYFERGTNYSIYNKGNGEYTVHFKMVNLNDTPGFNKYTFNFLGYRISNK